MAQAPSSASRDAVRATVPKMIELTEKVLFGDVWERPELSKRDRSLIVCAVLTATYRPEQLRGHLQRALGQRPDQDRNLRDDHPCGVLCRLARLDVGGEHRPGDLRGQSIGSTHRLNSRMWPGPRSLRGTKRCGNPDAGRWTLDRRAASASQ